MEDKVTYNNDEELESVWIADFHEWFSESRKCKNIDNDYNGQQSIYSRFALVYDKAIDIENYTGPRRISEKIVSLYPDQKNIDILDYGCGTGLVADFLFAQGYSDIDGFDCNQDLLDVSASKKHTRKHILGRNTEGLETIEDNFYDVICSTGVFFLSHSHPNMSCFKDLCRLIRPGGYLLILTKLEYLSTSYVDMTVVDQLEKDGILKRKQEEQFEGYRQPFKHEVDPKSMGVLLSYEIM